jgi:hypothetical protein
MEELRHLDEVAYVRFASVYRSFQDVDAFREEIDTLQRRRRRDEVAGQLSFLEGEEPPGADAPPRAPRRAPATSEPRRGATDPRAPAADARVVPLVRPTPPAAGRAPKK